MASSSSERVQLNTKIGNSSPKPPRAIIWYIGFQSTVLMEPSNLACRASVEMFKPETTSQMYRSPSSLPLARKAPYLDTLDLMLDLLNLAP